LSPEQVLGLGGGGEDAVLVLARGVLVGRLDRVGERWRGRSGRRGEGSDHHLLAVRAADLLPEVVLVDGQQLLAVPALEIHGLHAVTSRPGQTAAPAASGGWVERERGPPALPVG